MPFLLRTNTNPGTAEWVDESSIIPTFEQFYLPEVILRPAGPANADNVYLTAAEARAALNAGSGTRAFVIEVPAASSGGVVLDAGTYGDADVVMIGRTSTAFQSWDNITTSFGVVPSVVGITLEGGVILPMTRFANLAFQVDNTVAASPIQPSGSSTYFFSNVRMSTDPFAPATVPFFDLQGSGGQIVRIYAENFIVQLNGGIRVGGNNRLDVYLRRGQCRLSGGFGAGAIVSNSASAQLRVDIDHQVYVSSEGITGFPSLETSFTAGGGTVQLFTISQSDGSEPERQPYFILAPAQPATLPPIEEVPVGFKITYTRDSAAGANATLQANAGDTLLPTDPISLAVGESATVMRVQGLTGTFWTTL